MFRRLMGILIGAGFAAIGYTGLAQAQDGQFELPWQKQQGAGSEQTPAPDSQEMPPANQDKDSAVIPVNPPDGKKDQAETAAPEPPTELGAVVVTAQKRTQRLVDVPINVSVISGQTVRDARIEQVRDVAGYVPGVDIKEQVPGAIPVVTIRGVGLDDFSSTNSPAAGIYVDQVPLSSLALMSFDLYDMERIEVLKGPQGTLYGRNSTAGAINVLSARPSYERESFLKLDYGKYQAGDAEGMFNLPLGDAFALRFAGKYIRQDKGFWKSRFNSDGTLADGTTPPPEPSGLPLLALLGTPIPPSVQHTDFNGEPVARTIGKRNIALGRVRGAWDATGDLHLDLKLDAIHQRSQLGQPELLAENCNDGTQPIDPDNCADGLGYQDTDRNPYLGDWAGKLPYNIDQMGGTLTADWNFGWARLAAVTGVIDLRRFFHIDVDTQPANLFNFLQLDKVTQYTQELRLSGAGFDQALDWLGGVFVSQDQVRLRTDGRHQDLIPGETSLITANQLTRSQAAFVNSDYHLTRAWALTGGLRYTRETRDYVGGTTWTPITIPGQLDNTFVDTGIQDTNLSWKFGTNYQFIKNSLAYANVSKGVKSGGFFSGVTSNQQQLQPYKPETLVSYEIGAKTQGPLSVNGSLFYYDYSDVQVFMRSNEVPVQFIGNVSKARVRGADLEALWRQINGLTLQSGVGLLHTELGSFTGPSGDDVPKGNRLANAPKLTFNTLARYELPFFGNLNSALQFDAHYSGAVFKEATNDPLIRQKSYWLYNARVSLLTADRFWDLSLWGRNLGDVRYAVQGLDVGAFALGNRNYNAPRTFGVELSRHFNF